MDIYPNSNFRSFSGEDRHIKNKSEHRQRDQDQQQQEVKLSPFTKRILIVDDDPDLTFTFKKAFEEADRIGGNKMSFHVDTYNDPLVALSEFEPDFYDLLLIDINLPKMNGFDFCIKIFQVDLNPSLLYVISANKSRSTKRTVSIIEHWLFY